jgi:hypothetical protein
MEKVEAAPKASKAKPAPKKKAPSKDEEVI